MSKSVEADLRAMGWSPEQIAAATIDGKPLLQAKAEPAKKHREPSKTEQAFMRHLDWLKSCGAVAVWWYEPFSLNVTDRDQTTGRIMRYTPDFLIVPTTQANTDYRRAVVEIKGGRIWDGAKEKFRMAVEKFSLAFRFSMLQKQRDKWVQIMGEPWLLG